MRNTTKEDIRCVSCKYGCQLTDRNNDILNRCPIQKIAVWPDSNHYLTRGVLSLVAGRYESVFCRGCIFVDFSIYNIRYLTNKHWIDYLKSTGLTIVLICDRALAALAAHWMKREGIHSVIYCEEQLVDIKRTINSTYYGLKGGAKRRVNALSSEEVAFLDLALKGNSLSSISLAMNHDIKKIYNMKDSIRRKTGTSLNQLLSGH
ncbi:LuxR family transcriptional regulator [Pantoea rwandensis]|uniref:LuxR family transcriptional regulator n=1 Tax=Pantoea rwandensis TaxID=1076550 RepID=A0A1X1CSK1_9GAMM|nr:LuxR family transcriptional regulator [Pantoea rwandensis]ORM67317.1 LuxR family transcriptional regulator [Pantoea rwandensis]